MGASVYHYGSWETGKKAVEQFMEKKVGLNTAGLSLNDGSGLSHKNKVSPHHIAQLLRWMYFSSPHKEVFMKALPIGGVDGTLRRRLKHKHTKSNVKAKTGNLPGITSLAGYIMTKQSDPLLFVVIVNRPKKSAVGFKRTLEDSLCAILATHASIY